MRALVGRAGLQRLVAVIDGVGAVVVVVAAGELAPCPATTTLRIC